METEGVRVSEGWAPASGPLAPGKGLEEIGVSACHLTCRPHHCQGCPGGQKCQTWGSGVNPGLLVEFYMERPLSTEWCQSSAGRFTSAGSGITLAPAQLHWIPALPPTPCLQPAVPISA